MSSELTITNIEAVVTKLRLEPGDVLLVRTDCRTSIEERKHIESCFGESFGVPVVALPDGLKLEAVLNMPPELIERARQLGEERIRAEFDQLRGHFSNVRTKARHDDIAAGNAAGESSGEAVRPGGYGNA